jgi:hypothetical protein
MPMRLIGLCWAAALLLVGCVEDLFGASGCDEAGCADAEQLTLSTAGGTWPAGRYEFEFSFDGERHACAIEFPRDVAINYRL